MTSCHYGCGRDATTRDHVVPAAVLRLRYGPNGPSRTSWPPGAANIVPACEPCNAWKADLPSSCACAACALARDEHGTAAWRAGPVATLPPPADFVARLERRRQRAATAAVRPSPLSPEVAWCFPCDRLHERRPTPCRWRSRDNRDARRESAG